MEMALLTEKNLKKLNKPQLTRQLSTPSSSTTTTEIPPGYDEWFRNSYGNPTPYKRTPSPSPPLDTVIVRGPEKPRSAKAVQVTHEPHQCALGIKCLLEIDNLNYHRIMATYLVARARRARLPVAAIDPDRDYNDLEGLKNFSDTAATSLLDEYRFLLELHAKDVAWFKLQSYDTSQEERLNPMTVLKEIQIPEYWETERRYLESPGCLSERQKASASAIPVKPLPSASSINGDHKSLHPATAESRSELTQEIVALDVLMAGQLPPRAPSRKLRSRTQLSTSPASPTSSAKSESRDHSDGRKAIPARHLAPVVKGQPPPSDAFKRMPEQALGKRKPVEQAAVGDDFALKRRKTSEYDC
jgi:hypothetical protein